MGWYYQPTSRAELIDSLVASRGPCTCIKHCTRGNVLWTVWQTPSGAMIGCDLMQRSGDMWGHKPMDESMHPFYYTCPLSYLKLAPIASLEWRKNVLAKHATKFCKYDQETYEKLCAEYLPAEEVSA